MVKALIDINDSTNRILAVIKAEFGLKDKSQAINVLAEKYEEIMDILFEHKVKDSYIRKLKRLEKERAVRIGTLEDFKKMYHIKDV